MFNILTWFRDFFRHRHLPVPHEPVPRPVHPLEGPPRETPFRFDHPRDQLDANELLEAEQSRKEDYFEIRPVSNLNQRQIKVRRLTACGFETKQSESFYRTSSGLIITRDELIGGGRCSVCNEYCDREHFFTCAVCGLGCCRLHVFFWEGHTFCPMHARQLLYEEDKWDRSP